MELFSLDLMMKLNLIFLIPLFSLNCSQEIKITKKRTDDQLMRSSMTKLLILFQILSFNACRQQLKEATG